MTTSIIGPAGGADFPDPATWFASFLAVLLDDETGNCQSDEIVVTVTQSLSGVTPGAFTILLTAGAGNSFADNANKLTNALRYNASNGAAIRKSTGNSNLLDIDCANFQLTRLQLKKDSAYGIIVNYITAGNTGRTIDQCIITHSGTDEVNTTCLVGEGGAVVTNTLVYSPNRMNGIKNAHANGNYQNVTIATMSAGTGVTGFGIVYGTPTLKNVVVVGYATDYAGTAGVCSNNATDKGSFGGTNFGTSGQVSVVPATEWENFSAGTEDFRVAAGSAKLALNGTASGTPSTDIVGQTRSGTTPTIGAWELIGAEPPAGATLMGQAVL